jgi:hypothetical protein
MIYRIRQIYLIFIGTEDFEERLGVTIQEVIINLVNFAQRFYYYLSY